MGTGESVEEFGTLVDDYLFLEELRLRLWDGLLGRPTARVQFPGAQPVSFARKHLRTLEAHDYYVCEKSDGVRYLLYFTAPYGRHTAFLIDRNFECREIPDLAIPQRGSTPQNIHFHEDTLIDGELICEVEGDKKNFIFLSFDALLMNGVNITGKSLPLRLKHIQNDVIAPIQEFKTKLPFSLCLKKMWKPYAVAEILHYEIPNLKHGNDGLIFTPVSDPYIAGTCESILKWKPSEMNTVDFLLRVNHEAYIDSERLELWVGNRDGQSFYAHHPWDPDLVQYDGLVIECRLMLSKESSPKRSDNQPNNLSIESSPNSTIVPIDDVDYLKSTGRIGSPSWKFTRVRRDKISGNNVRVVQKIIESISDNVTSEELIAAIPAIRRAWKARETVDRS